MTPDLSHRVPGVHLGEFGSMALDVYLPDAGTADLLHRIVEGLAGLDTDLASTDPSPTTEDERL
ncbi:hypothetical protein [Nocardia sp. NPDC048505]|uniref:hypothetical protein n=1 Tax=unclassified Nocardia TaxID=2637762 RepID=UPI0033EF8528